MDLNAFPNRVLLTIFDRVPLVDLVRHIPLVCRRWHSLQPSVLSGKKAIELTILVGPHAQRLARNGPAVILYSDELTNEDGSRMFPSPMHHSRHSFSITLSTFTTKRMNKLIDKLHNVTYLEMCLVVKPSVENTIKLVIHLLDHSAQTLKTLKFHCLCSSKKIDPQVPTSVDVQIGRLIATVNTLPVLEHLTLTFYHGLKLTKSLALPILGRLEEFHYYSACGKVDHLFRALKCFAESNPKLKTIGLGNKGQMKEYLTEFSLSSLAKSFTMLTCEDLPEQINERGRFLNTFTNLASFKIGMRDLDLTGLTHTLAPLNSLVQLFLRSEEPFSKFDSDPVDLIRSLPSVKVLVLMATTRTHKDLASPHWARMFPQVQIIFLKHSILGCSICGFEGDQFKSQKMTPCVQRTLLPLKQQFRRTLKKAYYSRDTDLRVFTPDTI